MLMSADSSDCSSSTKTSVICIPFSADSSSATSSSPSTSRSHLENALKLPPNTSVSAYYQHQQQSSSQDYRRFTLPPPPPPRQVLVDNHVIGENSVIARKIPHSNVIFVNKSANNNIVKNHNNNSVNVNVNYMYNNQNSSVVSTSDSSSSSISLNSGNINSSNTYHSNNHHMQQQQQQQIQHIQRPQTPDYIKSYPVMDNSVASSVKGEPELNIGMKFFFLTFFTFLAFESN